MSRRHSEGEFINTRCQKRSLEQIRSLEPQQDKILRNLTLLKQKSLSYLYSVTLQIRMEEAAKALYQPSLIRDQRALRPKVRGTIDDLYQNPPVLTEATSLSEKLGTHPDSDLDNTILRLRLTICKGKTKINFLATL